MCFPEEAVETTVQIQIQNLVETDSYATIILEKALATPRLRWRPVSEIRFDTSRHQARSWLVVLVHGAPLYFIYAQKKDGLGLSSASISGLPLLQTECHGQGCANVCHLKSVARRPGQREQELPSFDHGGASVLALPTSLAPSRLCLGVWNVWPRNWVRAGKGVIQGSAFFLMRLKRLQGLVAVG